MKNLYFKAKIGYDGEYVPVTTPQQLEEVLYLFQSKKDGYIGGRPIRGVDIITVVEDWNKALGVAEDWKLTGEDRAILARDGIKKRYLGVIEKYKRRVDYLLDNRQKHLIGQKVSIPELDAPQNKELIEGSKKLAEDMKMPK